MGWEGKGRKGKGTVEGKGREEREGEEGRGKGKGPPTFQYLPRSMRPSAQMRLVCEIRQIGLKLTSSVHSREKKESKVGNRQTTGKRWSQVDLGVTRHIAI